MENSENMSSGSGDNIFNKLEKVASVSSLTKSEREEYEQSLKRLQENLDTVRNITEYARRKGIEDEMYEIACRMKKHGCEAQIITMYIGFSQEEIEKLDLDEYKKSHNLEAIKKSLESYKAFDKLHGIDYHTLSREDRDKYDYSLMILRDNYAIDCSAARSGYEEGIKEAKYATARRMKYGEPL